MQRQGSSNQFTYRWAKTSTNVGNGAIIAAFRDVRIIARAAVSASYLLPNACARASAGVCSQLNGREAWRFDRQVIKMNFTVKRGVPGLGRHRIATSSDWCRRKPAKNDMRHAPTKRRYAELMVARTTTFPSAQRFLCPNVNELTSFGQQSGLATNLSSSQHLRCFGSRHCPPQSICFRACACRDW